MSARARTWRAVNYVAIDTTVNYVGKMGGGMG